MKLFNPAVIWNNLWFLHLNQIWQVFFRLPWLISFDVHNKWDFRVFGNCLNHLNFTERIIQNFTFCYPSPKAYLIVIPNSTKGKFRQSTTMSNTHINTHSYLLAAHSQNACTELFIYFHIKTTVPSAHLYPPLLLTWILAFQTRS